MADQAVGNVEIGQDIGSLQYRLSPWRILRYVDTTRDDNPWYRTDSPFGGVIAPPTIFDSDLLRLPGLRQAVDPHMRNLFLAGEDYEFYNPARPGMLITVQGRIADSYVRGSLEFIVFEGLIRDETGLDLARSFITYCWPVEQ